MTPIQQLFLGVGAAKKLYIDDTFTVYTKKAPGGSNAEFNVGINFAADGGMLLAGTRESSRDWRVMDTVRGTKRVLLANTSGPQTDDSYTYLSWDNDGYTFTSDHSGLNKDPHKHVWYNFAKKKGFLDIVSFTTTTNSNRRISHSLGCVPGMIIIKNLDDTEDWAAYHTSLGRNKYFRFNTDQTVNTSSNFWGSSDPTSTDFGFNEPAWASSGKSFIAYVFAGGLSSAATARSVDFDGTTDELEIPDSEDFNYGSGDFTLECWVNPNAVFSDKFLHAHTNSTANEGPCQLYWGTNNEVTLYMSSTSSGFDVVNGKAFGVCPVGVWSHIAVARQGNNIRMFFNGVNVHTISSSASLVNVTGTFDIGGRRGSDFVNAKISNFRVVKGTAVYTSTFTPPTEPLTNITNTVLLCCNDSSVTGSTVTPGTITANGDPTASTDSPFEDTAKNIYGDSKDQAIIKTGYYKGSSSVSPAVYLGFEPQFLLIKNVGSTAKWFISDTHRGIITGGDDARMWLNTDDQEANNHDHVDISPTGFIVKDADDATNTNNDEYVYLAIRRPDGKTGKEVANTDVFSLGLGASSNDVNFVTNFPVDLGITRDVTGSSGAASEWRIITRHNSKKYLQAESTDVEATENNYTMDNSTGWDSGGTDYNHWSFRRHAGLDVVYYTGTGAGQVLSHSCGQEPQMIWVKNRDQADNWAVYHKDVTKGGYANHGMAMALNLNGGPVGADFWNGQEPTATTFGISSSNGRVNTDNEKYMAILFSSVSGICKTGTYNGDGGTSNSITCGFQPRLVIIKRWDGSDTSSGNWHWFDSQMGFNKKSILNSTAAATNDAWISVNSTGFTILTSDAEVNNSSNSAKYIYYAHA